MRSVLILLVIISFYLIPEGNEKKFDNSSKYSIFFQKAQAELDSIVMFSNISGCKISWDMSYKDYVNECKPDTIVTNEGFHPSTYLFFRMGDSASYVPFYCIHFTNSESGKILEIVLYTLNKDFYNSLQAFLLSHSFLKCDSKTFYNELLYVNLFNSYNPFIPLPKKYLNRKNEKELFGIQIKWISKNFKCVK